jgi:hypothetical protein
MLLHRRRLTLLLLLHRSCLVLRLHRSHRTLLLLRSGLIAGLQRSRRVDVAIGRKRLIDGQIGWTAMVYAGELIPVGAGNVLILQLRPHGRSMLFVASRQFRGSGPDLQSTLTAVETDAGAAVFAHRTVVDVVHN